MMSATIPEGTCFSATATLPKPNPRSTNPRIDDVAISTRGTFISLNPRVRLMMRVRRTPAIRKRIPILRSGGIVSMTYAIAK
jgi:hypothetical protein